MQGLPKKSVVYYALIEIKKNRAQYFEDGL